ncbi:sensor histidine kinase [Flavobacterium sp. JP2137]|uniref:sensor histidine kinase n=1 Tax=Flavobacterium sp. JP2137 TaxID=3414510 RepID=UPI003D2FC607
MKLIIFVVMKNKNLLYIGASTLLFLLLLGIHAYYFYNSYKLKEKYILNTVCGQLSDLDDRVPYFEETPQSEDEILALFAKFEKKQIDFDEVTQYFRAKNAQISPHITAYIDSLFQKEGYRVAIKKEINYLITLPSKDTLIKTPLVLYETPTPIGKARTLTLGKSTTSSSNSDSDDANDASFQGQKKPEFSFVINRTTSYDIANLPYIVLSALTPLMLSSILILLSVLVLYYLTYKNLVKHREESLILHDIVDNIAHEFKTPIATLKIATKTLSKGGSLDVLPLIERQLNRLENLLQPIHFDCETTEHSAPLRPQDLTQLLADFSFSQPEVQFVQQIQFTQPAPLNKVEAQTIISNLVGNSIKYGAKHIEMHVQTQASHLEITVTDDGIGMESKEVKHILNKFYRIQKNNIQNTKGLGLGLYLIHTIVLKHGGTIAIKSQLQKGTTVKITIPYEN